MPYDNSLGMLRGSSTRRQALHRLHNKQRPRFDAKMATEHFIERTTKVGSAIVTVYATDGEHWCSDKHALLRWQNQRHKELSDSKKLWKSGYQQNLASWVHVRTTYRMVEGCLASTSRPPDSVHPNLQGTSEVIPAPPAASPKQPTTIGAGSFVVFRVIKSMSSKSSAQARAGSKAPFHVARCLTSHCHKE